MTNTNQKCYNSFSCIASILIIAFILGSIIWDICVTKPEIKSSIQDVQVEIKSLHKKIDSTIQSDSTILFEKAYNDSIK